MKDKDRDKDRDRDRDKDRDRSRKDRDSHRRDKDRSRRSRYVTLIKLLRSKLAKEIFSHNYFIIRVCLNNTPIFFTLTKI